MAEIDWKCAGCGKQSPDRRRSCGCPTNVVISDGGGSAWKIDMIAGKSLAEWREFARRDDCLDRMVPSDLRQLLSKIPDTR